MTRAFTTWSFVCWCLTASMSSTTLLAQDVAIELRAATAITIDTAPSSTSVPIGPLPIGSQVNSSSPGGNGKITWISVADDTAARFEVRHELFGNATSGPHEFLFEVTATSLAPVYIELTHEFVASNGAPVPTALVDIGNDGTPDAGWVSPYSLTYGQFTLGPQPLEIRVQFAGTASGGSIVSDIGVRVTPRNNVQLLDVSPGCTQTSIVVPSFRELGVVALAAQPPINALSVLVAGFSPQPVVLPTPFVIHPCLLVPNLDVLVPFFNATSIHIPLPFSVRPADLWLQRVSLIGGQLMTDDAYWVRAN